MAIPLTQTPGSRNVAPRARSPISRTQRHRLLQAVGMFLMLVGAALMSIQIRLQVPIGREPWAGYQSDSPMFYLLMIIAVVLVQTVSILVPPTTLTSRIVGEAHPARRFLVALFTSFFLILVFHGNISQLQLVYFLGAGVLLAWLCIVVPRRLYVGQGGNSLERDLEKLVGSLPLINLWLRTNIRARYSQTTLGILWIILLPLLASVVLALAFTQILRIQLDVPIVSFILSAMIPYTLFSNAVLNSAGSILGKVSLITQVYFPREILPIVVLGEALVDAVFTFGSLFIINALLGIFPNIYWVYLPPLLLLLITITMGAMFLVSSLSVAVRDIPQLMGVLMQLVFYLTPVIYPVEQFPASFRWLFVLNPVAPIIQAFRDVLVFARPPDSVTLFFPIVFAGVVLYLGYVVFKRIESRMADMA